MKYSLRDRMLRLQRHLAAVGILPFAALALIWLPMTVADYASEMGTRPIHSVLSMLAAMIVSGLVIWPAWEAWKQAWMQPSTDREPPPPKPRFGRHPEPPSWGKPPPVRSARAPKPSMP